MSFVVSIKRSARQEFGCLTSEVRERIQPALVSLQNDPFPNGYKKLRGGRGYRVRVGDYRILYDIDLSVREITVYAIVHRRDAY